MAVRASAVIGLWATRSYDSMWRSPLRSTCQPIAAVTQPAVTQAKSNENSATCASRSRSKPATGCASSSSAADNTADSSTRPSNTVRRWCAAWCQLPTAAGALSAGAFSKCRAPAVKPVQGRAGMEPRLSAGAASWV